MKGQSFAMSQHGFARDMEFTLVQQKADSLTFVLEDNAETLAVPFPLPPDDHLYGLWITAYRLHGKWIIRMTV